MKKMVLITGCSTGIGLVCAKMLHKRGYHVLATCRGTKDVVRMRQLGMDSFTLDVDSSSSIRNAVKEVEKRGGRLYALFNNAGMGIPGAIEDLSRDILRRQFETNLFGAVELTNTLLPLMREQKQGRIIFNSSVLGFVSIGYRGAYGASKYAMEGICDTYRLELPSYLKVVLIEPGPVTSKFRVNAYKNFVKFIDPKKSFYRRRYQSLLARLKDGNTEPPFTLPETAVGKKLIHALESKNPKPRYYVTFPTHYFGYMKRFVSTRFLDRMLKKIS